MLKLTLFILFFLTLFFLTACSKQQLYQSAQHYERSICQQQQGAAYDECMARSGKAYEDYEREREQAITP